MAVYVDDAIWAWVGKRWCHLLADDTDELHYFAAQLGVHRLIYQGPPKTSTTRRPSSSGVSGLIQSRESMFSAATAAEMRWRRWPQND